MFADTLGGSYWQPVPCVSDTNSARSGCSSGEYINTAIGRLENNSSVGSVVIVTSKIVVSSDALSYTRKRSVYSTEERLEQVIETIQDAKARITTELYDGGKKVLVILIDNSVLPQSKIARLQKEADVFLNKVHDARLNYYTDKSLQKGAGEVLQMLSALKFLEDKRVKFERLFKITGRYRLNDKFLIQQYLPEKSMFKKNTAVQDGRQYYFTSFFKICRADSRRFAGALHEVFRAYQTSNFERYGGWQDEEVLLPALMGGATFTAELETYPTVSLFEDIKHLGLVQRGATSEGRAIDNVRRL